MANLTIRNLDDEVKERLRIEAARHGRSMEEEVRHILRQAVAPPAWEQGLGSRIVERFRGGGWLRAAVARAARAAPLAGLP